MERFELLKNIMIYATVKHQKNMSEYKVLYSNLI